MAAEVEEVRPRRWYFTKEELANSPSRADGVDPEKELRYRQDAASLIQEMGPRLGLSPLCVSTAIVYVHRFYMINSFKAFDRGIIATAALFLAAKVEELPKKLEYVAKCSYSLLHREAPALEVPSEAYNKIVDDITFHELTILQTLGFDVQVKHPHPHVVECMNLVGVSKDLSQAAFFLAHNSQLLTTFCLQHSPTVVACMCIHLTCVWKGLEIPRSNDNKNWWEYVDKNVTQTKLEELAKEFLTIVEKSPTRLKKRIQENFKMAVEGSRSHSTNSSSTSNLHGNRQPTAPGMSSGSSSNAARQQKDYHMLHPSAIPGKHHHHQHHQQQQHGTNPSVKQQVSSSHQHKTAAHRMSPPPPPPPPLPHTSHSAAHNSHVHKHRKHKDHHNMPPPTNSAGPSTSQRPEKHSLTDPGHQAAHRSKKQKTEDSQSQHKQHLSLNDYRQSKRQYQVKGQPSSSSNNSSNSRRKPPDGNARMQFHSSDSNLHLGSLPLMSNPHSHHKTSSSSSSTRMHPNHTPLPPLPPPLPSQVPEYSPPPPPPPFTNS